jgi:hypothetical protein
MQNKIAELSGSRIPIKLSSNHLWPVESGLRSLAATLQEPVQESIIGLFQASAIGRLSAADLVHEEQQHDGDDHDHGNC